MSQEANMPAYLTARMAMARILRDKGLEKTDEVSNETCWIDWIREALDTFCVSSLYVRRMSTRIPIQNCSAPKPCDLVQLVDVWVETPIGTRVKPDFSLGGLPMPQTSYTNEREFVAPTVYTQIGISDSGPTYTFTPNANRCTLLLDYRAYSTSPEGQPVIPMTWMPAIREYCWMMYMSRSMASGLQQFSMGQLDAVRADVDKLVARARWADINDKVTDDTVHRLMAMFNDPFYVDQNPYANAEKQRDIDHAYGGTDTPTVWRRTF